MIFVISSSVFLFKEITIANNRCYRDRMTDLRSKESLMADENTTPQKDNEEVEEIEVLDQADGTALPEAGASSGGFVCCSSSSSCCSAG